MKRLNIRLKLFDDRGVEAHTVKSLKLMIWAVAFGTISFNITGGVAMTGYLKELGTSDFIFGLLFAIGPAIAPIQLAASYILESTRKRKQLFMIGGIIHRTVWLPFGLIPFFIPMEQNMLRIWMAALFLCINALAGPFVNVTFFSLAADIVPMNIRGRYFAVRSRIATAFGVAGGIMTAWFLDTFTGFNSYALVFSLAAVAGTTDILHFIFVKFPPMVAREQKEKFFAMLSAVFKNKKYIKFILFITCWLFAVNISGPFYLVHLRNGVGFNNTLITLLLQIMPNLCSIMIVFRWGRNIDSHGNRTIMRIAGSVLCFIPFIWIFTGNETVSIFLVAAIGLLNGFLLPGFDLCVNNMMLGYAPQVNRSMYIAVYAMVTSIIGIGAANVAGGWLLDNVFAHIEPRGFVLLGVVMSRYNYNFALTALLRCVMLFAVFPRLLPADGGTPVKEVIRLAADHVKKLLFRRALLKMK